MAPAALAAALAAGAEMARQAPVRAGVEQLAVVGHNPPEAQAALAALAAGPRVELMVLGERMAGWRAEENVAAADLGAQEVGAGAGQVA